MGITRYYNTINMLNDGKEAAMEWRASHILVKDRPLAEDILKKLKQGGQFESLARQFSTCPSKSSGGDLGWFGPGKMVAAFESAVKRLSPGSIGDVVQTQFGYHIIKCTGRKD
jgi:peptidyl-prolyl cis-trans isomerase C